MNINSNDIPEKAIMWRGSKEEFIEFVMIVTDYSICTNEKIASPSKERFMELCDALGNELLKFFKVDISPHATFKIMRENTPINYRFTKRIVRIMKRLKEDEQFILLLEARGIMPSFEYVTEEVIKWSNAEKIATILWLHIRQL
ncbi:hypothetical protein [Chitinophaga terrae (ex Kim and Jung 2007)]|jgi:hypothetical protein|uniref:hypothetical protein n=1 Tax=Chitinophaga terrae (ex Kim and Jung 2007) TaxID=408074 RepID=UPI0026317437|nr:hypothetical protein [Chitinophaga terrae (ex Kim and Jung 2007)]MDQ0109131.1 hypothetical protein [Chitinophaga terrae (ex Kim and Jung 2007)]